MAAASQDGLYTPAQIETYLKYISFPSHRFERPLRLEEDGGKADLKYLTALQRYQLAGVPFENLSLHYSRVRGVSIDKDDLFEKIVGRGNGRGGYCMENNQFFSTALKSMGFDVIAAGARVFRTDGNFGGWSHQVSIVIIAGTPYLVDVGFGGQGPLKPIPLEHNSIANRGATGASNRLVFQEPSHSILQGNWTLQHRISETSEWTSLYIFNLVEFFRADFEVMNFTTSTKSTSFFTYHMMCVKMIIDEKVDDIVGVIILEGGRVKRRVGAVTEELVQCKTEEERIAALRTYFGITLSKGEIDGIRGLVTELKPE